MNPIVWNGELGMKIPAGADLLCQIHYAPSSVDEWDRSSINIFTKPADEVEREVQMKMWLRLDINIPSNTETQIEACLNFSNSSCACIVSNFIYRSLGICPSLCIDMRLLQCNIFAHCFTFGLTPVFPIEGTAIAVSKFRPQQF